MSSGSQHLRQNILQISIWSCWIIGVGLIALCLPLTSANHLKPSKSRPVSWLYLDVVELPADGSDADLIGYLWFDTAQEHTFQITSDGGIDVRLGDAFVYQKNDKKPLATETVTVDLPAGAVPISLRYQSAIPPTPRLEISLKENGQLLAPWQLYPTEPDQALVTRQWWAWHGLWSGLVLVALGLLSTLGQAIHSLTTNRKEWLAIAAVTGVSAAARLAVADERYQSVPDYYAMQSIWDNFVDLSRAFLAGQFQLAGSYYQQGAIVYMALVQVAVGPNLWNLYVANVVLSSLACLCVLLAAWQLFGRGVGLLAGSLMAVYAPLIHYQTTLQIVVPATLASALVLVCGAWLLRRATWQAAVACGVAAALATLGRSPLIATALFGPLAALLAQSPAAPQLAPIKQRIGLSGLALLSFVLAALPMTLANAQVNVYSISSSGFPIAFFRGNNRDTLGVNEYLTQRELLAKARSGDENNFNPETWRDINTDVPRWIRFLIHKVGMFWSGQEYSDRMIDFYTTGLTPSRVLQTLWLNGIFSLGLILACAILGIVIGLQQPVVRPALIVIGLCVGAFMTLTVLFPVTGRVRTPIQPFLFPLAAYGLSLLQHWRLEWRKLAIAGVVALSTLGLARFVETRWPGPAFVTRDQLPATLTPTNIEFDGKIRLIGFDAYDCNFRSNGYLDLTLYWETLTPIESDYTVFIHLLDSTLTRVGGIDQPLGTANFPALLTSQWQPGQILRQSYYVPLPASDQSLPLRISLGLRTDTDRLPITASQKEILANTAAVLTGVALLPESQYQPLKSNTPTEITFSNQIQLVGLSLANPRTIASGSEQINFTLDWLARAHPTEPYHLFLHLLDTQGQLVSQYDGQLDSVFPTDTWAPNTYWRDSYTIAIATLPPGDYQLVAGLYKLANYERLSLTGSRDRLLPDNRLLLSTIHIQP